MAYLVAAAALMADARAQEQRLADTGLYRAGSTDIAAGNLPFSPQYPLWSDGATKRRWLHIPPGRFIDASRPDAWDFPPGTKLWKEFSHGRRVETRLIERLEDGNWRFAAYVWNEAGTDATLAPEAGMEVQAAGAVAGRYAIPAQADCRACHEGAAVPVLGVGALQLSPDRDPLAPRAEPRRHGEVDLRDLVARGLLRNLPPAHVERAPRVAAATPAERAALGYLHGNCGHCHNDNGAPPPVDLVLAQRVQGGASVTRSLAGAPSRFRLPGLGAAPALVEPGRPEKSVLAVRMRSRNPRTQMPPLGTQQPDDVALELIERWILNQPETRKEH
jgi:hypothetical protein